jgi:hypothetical protein
LACPADGPEDPSGTGDGDGDTGDEEPCAPSEDSVDESSCGPLGSDYVGDDSDQFPACISDGGTYELIADPPGSIGRVGAFEQIADILWRDGRPSSEDFIDARTIYEEDQGLGSRVSRREDLHYPPIPPEDPDWDPGVEDSKQCTVSALVDKYPDRCAGPAKIEPIINQAFIDGANGDGDANAHAARIEAAGMWFLYLSVYKEANTCFTGAAKDCDSSWAYYTGGHQVDGDVIGLAGFLSEHAPYTHQRVFDGILGVRCVRDLYPEDDYPTWDDLPAAAQDLFNDAWEQIDEALHRGLAVVLRQHLLAQNSCEAANANWGFLQIAGPVLDREAADRGAAGAAELAAIWELAEPAPEDIDRAVELLDEIFDCP